MNFFFGYDTSIGRIYISSDEEGVIGVDFDPPNFILNDTHFIKLTYKQILQYLNGDRKNFEVPIHLIGTSFQKQVWNEIMKIPYGVTTTYKNIANNIGNSNASRAVGMACNKNPLLIVIPCHRVISSTGELNGYRCDKSIKEKLISFEKTN